MKRKKKNNPDFKSKVIERQSGQIRSLEQQISDMEIDCDIKEEVIKSIEPLKKELEDTIADLKLKGEKYDELIDDLMHMRKVMNQNVFKGRWKIIKWLFK